MSLVKLMTTALTIFNSFPSNLLSITNCDVTSKFNYLNGTLTPEVPQLNENFTLSVGYLNNYQVINGGRIDYIINFNGLPYSYSEPLCSTNLPCPIELGEHIVSSNPTSLSQVGKFVINQQWISDANEVLLCTNTVIKIAQPQSQPQSQSQPQPQSQPQSQPQPQPVQKIKRNLRA